MAPKLIYFGKLNDHPLTLIWLFRIKSFFIIGIDEKKNPRPVQLDSFIIRNEPLFLNCLSRHDGIQLTYSHKKRNIHPHSVLIRILIQLKGTAKLTAQVEQVCLKDSEYILFEILGNRKWKGRTSSCRPSQPNCQIGLAWLA